MTPMDLWESHKASLATPPRVTPAQQRGVNLNADHWQLIEGLLADYQITISKALKGGWLLPHGEAAYRRDLALAGEALAEIRGRDAP